MRALTAVRAIDALGAGLLGLTFLLPVGDGPWFSFWREWMASIATLLILVGAVARLRDQGGEVRIGVFSLPAAACLLAAVPWMQWMGGVQFYWGDAVLVSAYLLCFGLCITVARSLPAADRASLADRVAAAMLFAAACSVPLAVLQWVGWLRLDLGAKVVAGRPVAHMEQTNLLCSLMIQGVLGAWRLRERGLLGRLPFGMLALALSLVAVLTQSRVAWLVLVAVAAAFIWRRNALQLSGRGPGLIVTAAVVVGGALALPWVDSQLGLTGLALQDRVTGGRRPDVWLLFIDAVAHRPWTGWGALQNGAAQVELAPAHPALFWLFTSAHDVVLDLVVWFGVPVGLAAGGALIIAVLLRMWRAPDAAAFVTALSSTALLLHGLVELPLFYTFFLFPMGLTLGAVGGDEMSARSTWRLRLEGQLGFAMLGLVPALLLMLLARDYVPLSDTRPVLVLDRAASHASLNASPDTPDALLLDQLRAYHAYAAHLPVSGLSAADIDGLRPPMLRFPFQPSQELYAHVLALNGRPEQAIDALNRGCTFVTPIQCDMSRGAWNYWRSQGEPLPVWPPQR